MRGNYLPTVSASGVGSLLARTKEADYSRPRGLVHEDEPVHVEHVRSSLTKECERVPQKTLRPRRLRHVLLCVLVPSALAIHDMAGIAIKGFVQPSIDTKERVFDRTYGPRLLSIHP